MVYPLRYSYIKFHENPSSGIRVVPCGRMDGQTDMVKLIVASPNFANASKTCQLTVLTYCFTPKMATVTLSEKLAPVGQKGKLTSATELNLTQITRLLHGLLFTVALYDGLCSSVTGLSSSLSVIILSDEEHGQ